MSPKTTATPSRPASRGRFAGFTLIELMIVVAIATILMSIAIPLYLHQVRESRRTDARAALVELAAREERYFDTNSAYTPTASQLGYSGFGTSYPVGNGAYYYISPPTISNTATPPTFSLKAQPLPGKGQDLDTDCASFTVTSAGQQSSLNSGGADSSSICWGH
ncbi:MAG TPA: type IV pilin protein [Steroidobacteraceae bacterium]|jgi:type IV pilus assembly protein PilE